MIKSSSDEQVSYFIEINNLIHLSMSDKSVHGTPTWTKLQLQYNMCLPECKQDLVLDKYISVHTCTGLWMLIQCSWSEMSLDWVCDEQKAAVSSPPPSCFAHTEESAEEKKKTLLQKILKSYSIFMERIEQFLNYHYTSNPLLKHRNTVEVKNRFNVM